jgi:hypothetical protein
MSEVKIEYNRKYKEKLDKVKEISKRNWKPFTIGVVLTGVTFIVTKRVSTRHINTTVMRIHKMTIKDCVFYIQTYARKQGPPSYVIRCIETGEIFTSQAEACRQLGIDPSRLSRHLNGHKGYETILGNGYKRAAVAVPRSS